MRQLKIDLSELEIAFEGGSEMISYYLDMETGEVINISDEDRSLLESIYETYYDEQSQTVNWDKAFNEERIPDWQQDSIQTADRIEADVSNRYSAIPSQGSNEGYRDMQDFIDTVHSPLLQERLERAISGRGAFRYFKDVLLDYPDERERWFQFKNAQMTERMLDWLETLGITPQGQS
jgi:hypothetical protein